MTVVRATLDHRATLVAREILDILVAKASRAMTEVKVILDQRVILVHRDTQVAKVILDILAHKAILDQKVTLVVKAILVVKAT